MKKVICIICLMLTLLVSGCAGRKAYPVKLNQNNDHRLSCEAMEQEMAKNKVLITKKIKHDKSKFASNTFWFIVLPFLMDVKEAEKVEAEALQRRNERLQSLWISKGCK